MVRGALEMVNLRVEVTTVQDLLRGDRVFELRVTLLETLQDDFPFAEDD